MVQGLAFRVYVFGNRDQESGIRIWGLKTCLHEFEVQGIQSSRFRVFIFGFTV